MSENIRYNPLTLHEKEINTDHIAIILGRLRKL